MDFTNLNQYVPILIFNIVLVAVSGILTVLKKDNTVVGKIVSYIKKLIDIMMANPAHSEKK